MAQTAALPTYSAIYAFGDSLSDAGNLSITTTAAGATQPVSPPYFKQQYGPIAGNVFSNGPTWVQNLSIALGLGTLAPSMAAGTDFAYGGAQTGSTPQNGGDAKIQAISLGTQFTQFQVGVLKPSANALYTLSIGSNDLLAILANPGLSEAQQTADVNVAVTNEIGFLKQLVGDGAKNLLVLDVPDLGKTPEVTLGLADGSNTPSPTLTAEATRISSAYNAALVGQLGTIAPAGTVKTQVVDTSSLLNSAIADPAAFGLTDVTSRVWNGTYTSAGSGTLAATGAAAQDQFLFWDALHPTETGHQAIADLGEQQLSGTPVLTVLDTTTSQPVPAQGTPYTGPVAGLQQQYINITPDSLNITASTPNWFIHSGGGTDGIAVTGGTNVLDGGAGSTFFSGGSGTDSFYVDDRNATASFWSTVAGFHARDGATLWGVTQNDFTFSWLDGQGAPGFTGLTLVAASVGRPLVGLTLVGYTTADLANGRLAVAFGTDAASGSGFMNIHANA